MTCSHRPRLAHALAGALASLLAAGTVARAETGAASLTPEQIRRAQRRYAHEPPVQQVVSAALQAAASDPARARKLAQRARLTGWIPRLRLSARRGVAQDLSERRSLDDDQTRLSTDDDLKLQATLSFRLDRLLFDRSEVALAREQRRLEEHRRELVRTVVHLYYERRRLQLERDLLGARDLDHTLRIEEAGALLDAMTDGAFRAMMGR